MSRLLTTLLLLLLSIPSSAGVFNPGGVKQTFNPNNTNAGVNVGANALLPSSPIAGDMVYDSTNTVFKFYEAGSWKGLGVQSEADTLQTAFARGKSITGANSLANAFRFGDGTTQMCAYTDSVDGPIITPCTDANVRQRIPATKTGGVYDVGGATDVESINPSAASANAMYTYGSAYRPLGTIVFDAGGINVDGTNCTVPTEQALNASEKTWAFSCADSNSSIFSGKVRMPKRWDGGTITFTLSLFHGTTETITFAGNFSAQCRGAGDTINSTYGTAVAANVSITTANQIAEATSAAVTPNGTCAGDKFVLWRYVVDSVGFSTNAANSKVLSVTIKYKQSSRSD